MAEHPSVAAMWAAWLATLGEDPAATDRVYTAWHFCDTQPCADELAALVVAGTKRATASSMWTYEDGSTPMPTVGELSVITDFAGVARCIIETTSLEIVPFGEVDEAFAREEGEGDGSLAYWRDAHARYFSRTLPAIGRALTDDMPVLCERFKVIHRP